MTQEQREYIIHIKGKGYYNFWEETNTPRPQAKTFILSNVKEELKSTSSSKRETTNKIIWLAIALPDSDLKLEILHELLLMPGHFGHQVVTRELQDIGSPSSIPYLDQVLEGGFEYLKQSYSGESDESIAKWFSHALASIETDDAFSIIHKHTRSPNPVIAQEMNYRIEEL